MVFDPHEKSESWEVESSTPARLAACSTGLGLLQVCIDS